jgi:hypothetical protein
MYTGWPIGLLQKGGMQSRKATCAGAIEKDSRGIYAILLVVLTEETHCAAHILYAPVYCTLGALAIYHIETYPVVNGYDHIATLREIGAIGRYRRINPRTYQEAATKSIHYDRA